MRIQHRYLTFDKNDKLVRLLNKLTIKHTVSEKSYSETVHFYALEFHLYEDNPRFTALREAVDEFDIEPQIGTVYEKADYDNAEWFIVRTGEYQYPQPEDDFGYLKATFNLDNDCRLCGIGKVQNAPYRLKSEPKQLNNQFWGLHWAFEAIFVRQEARNILERENIKGISFSRPVLHKSNNEVESLYQLHIETILDKGFDSYNTKQITCKIHNEEGLNTTPDLKCCGRIKFQHPRIGGYLFDKAVFNQDFDIIHSNEFFGSGRSANRLQIVSKGIKQLIDKNKLKGFLFIPIVHERFKR